jgi:hypothetical protein
MKNGRFFIVMSFFSYFFINLAGKMAKQTLVFESPKELSLKDNMIVIKDRDTEEMTLRSLEDKTVSLSFHLGGSSSLLLQNQSSKGYYFV